MTTSPLTATSLAGSASTSPATSPATAPTTTGGTARPTVVLRTDADGTGLAALRLALDGPVRVELPAGHREPMRRSRQVLEDAVDRGDVVYAVTTGFGKLASRSIPRADVVELQHRLIRSHQVGVGPLLPDRVVRTVLVLKLLSLVQGVSAVRTEVTDLLAAMVEHDLLPCVPSQGSVGASGDLAPLAHLTAALLGEGEVRVAGRVVPAADALAEHGLRPLTLQPKEAIALINGTQVSTALALAGLVDAERVFRAALAAGALSLEALAGNLAPFDARIHQVRRQQGQIEVAAALRELLDGSPLMTSADLPRRTQDMYSLRCQPQVMGAALDLLRTAGDLVQREANAVTDNPLVFPDDAAVLSGGNFHAEPVAFAADLVVMAVCEVGSLSERRQFALNDETLSGGLPAFLTAEPGLDSGMTMTQVTSAALVAENRGHAFPRSVDNVPTVANQEDHVSMATHAARRVAEVAANAAVIVANELVMAAQGVALRAPLCCGPRTERVREQVGRTSPFLAADRPLGHEVQRLAQAVLSGELSAHVGLRTVGDL